MALAGQDTNVKRRDASGPGQAERFPIVSMVLLALTFIGMMISIWMIFLYAPTDAIEGDAQRIFYFHLPSAIIGMLSLGIVALGGIVYLGTNNLGYMVDLGCAPDHDLDPLVYLYRLSHVAQLHGPHPCQRARRRGTGDHWPHRCPYHL